MWLIIGLILGAGIMALFLWLHRRGISVTLYELILGAIGFLLLLFTIQNFANSFIEHEPLAAWKFLLVFGLPAVILLIITYLLVWRRYSKAG